MAKQSAVSAGWRGFIAATPNCTLPEHSQFLCMGQTVIAVAGTLAKVSDLAALDMRLKLSGVSMGRAICTHWDRLA